VSKIRAKFFKDGKRDMVEVTIVGDPNTLIEKVTPARVAEFPREWESYQGGLAVVDVGGTDLTEVPGITRDMATAMRLKGVRNVEELAALDDAATKSLGMQGLAFRRTAQLLLKEKEHDALKALTAEVKRGPGRPPNPPEAGVAV